MEIASANTAAARALVAGLAARGVRHVCVTPGSRSTPLTVAFAEQTAVRPWLHLDERSSAFFALGIAKATGQPVALVCTSGTASANFFPAVAEANLARVPLIVCTTDRPPRLRNVGAPQTIDQVGLFGRHVRLSLDLDAPGKGVNSAGTPDKSAQQAIEAATGPLPGPVHLNLPFEEPLIAGPGQHPAPETVVQGELMRPAPQEPDRQCLEVVKDLLDQSTRPLLIAGPEVGGLPAKSITALATRFGVPVLADPLSGLRTGGHDRNQVLDSYDALFRAPLADAMIPDLILRFGAIPTSKALGQFLEQRADITQVLVDAPGSNRDPFASASVRLSGDAASTATALLNLASFSDLEDGWIGRWLGANDAARDVMRRQAGTFPEMFEGRVFTELQQTLPAGATIFAGNSMPVRDMDSFLFNDDKHLRLESNRGANGIDGVISSALGVAAVRDERVVLVIGDVSFYHDMNGLWAAKRHGLDLTIVVVNNEGGGIFNYLSQAQHGSVFEEWFATPPGIEPRFATEMYGGRHTVAEDWETFRSALKGSSGLNVIEVPTDRLRNVAMHRQAWDEVAAHAWPGG